MKMTQGDYIRCGDGDFIDATDLHDDELEAALDGDRCLIPAGTITVQELYDELMRLGWSREECDEFACMEQEDDSL